MKRPKHKRILMIAASAACFLFALSSIAAANFSALRGKIITSNTEIDVPETEKDFVKKLTRQDRAQLRQNSDGFWVIHFVAFFNKPLHNSHVGIVLLDTQGNPVTVASIAVNSGQSTLASELVIEAGSASPGRHVLQVYYAKNNRPVVLAKKPIVLK